MKNHEQSTSTPAVLEPPTVEPLALDEPEVVIDLRHVVPTPYGARLEDLEILQRTW